MYRIVSITTAQDTADIAYLTWKQAEADYDAAAILAATTGDGARQFHAARALAAAHTAYVESKDDLTASENMIDA